MTQRHAWLRALIFSLSGLVIFSAILGGWLARSAVPFFDSWDGGVGFLLNLPDNPGLFLAHHNEHRIVITRLLLWVDFYLFGGRDMFLVLTNYLFAFGTWCALWSGLKSINRNKVAPRDLNLVGAVIAAWLLLWSQDINFTWGFQSQVHAAQFFPLLSFLLLSHAAQNGPRAHLLFGGALVLGIVSAGTMANGALTLGFMAIWALVLRMRVWQIVLLTLLGGLILRLYMMDYSTPSGHTTILETIQSYPIATLVFTFEFLGNPFAHVIGPFGAGRMIVMLLGMILTGSAAYLTYSFIRERPTHPVIPGLVLYIIYVGATAFLTAGGRLFIHEYASLTSRYTTPSVVAWAALVCIISPWMFRRFYSSKQIATGFLVFAALGLMAMFVPIVRKGLPPAGYHDTQAVAVLALELGVRDDEQIGSIYPRAPVVLTIADRATAIDLGVFKHRTYRGLRESIGTFWIASDAPRCRGQVLQSNALEMDRNHLRVQGQIEHVLRGRKRARVLLINDNGMIIGAGLTEAPRRDANLEDGAKWISPFTGYLRTPRDGPIRFASQTCRTK
ncbi:MAG: hypothetical protein AAFY82_06940 [Pseudomonadota bacterium]